MSTLSRVLDMLLHLGEQIDAAVEAGDWARVSDLVDRRARAVEQLPPSDEQGDRSAADQRKIDALAAQNQSLMERLRERRDELEEGLAQIGDLRHAQNSYEETPAREGVLPAELEG